MKLLIRRMKRAVTQTEYSISLVKCSKPNTISNGLNVVIRSFYPYRNNCLFRNMGVLSLQGMESQQDSTMQRVSRGIM